MLRRLLLATMFITAAVPAFADITSESVCNSDTFGGVSEGSVDIEAYWNPLNFTCDAGNYLDATAGDCQSCPSGSWCSGVDDQAFDGENHGIMSCPSEFPSSLASASSESQCWKNGTAMCAENNPYMFGNGTANYANTSADCKTYFGTSNCQLNESDACDITSLNCNEHYEQKIVDGDLRCVRSSVVCPAGTYLAAGSDEPVVCPEDYYCAGGTYDLGTGVDTGLVACASGLKSPVGSRYVNDCGRILHIGDVALHVHPDKRTEHSLAINVDGVKYYADATPVVDGEPVITATPNTTKVLKVKMGDTEYYIHETIYE